MLRFFKTLLFWLLIAALPLQGMAAAVQAFRGPAHHTAQAATAMHQQHGDHHDMSAHAAHQHDDASGDHQHKHDSYAACCGAVAPPSVASNHIPAPAGVTTLVLRPADSFISFIPSSLERPPRPFSA